MAALRFVPCAKFRPLGVMSCWIVPTGGPDTNSCRVTGLTFKPSGPLKHFGKEAFFQLSLLSNLVPSWSESEFREGLWSENQKLSGQSYVFSTDATGGPDSADVRLRIVAFAVLAFTKDGDHLHPVASITGFLP